MPEATPLNELDAASRPAGWRLAKHLVYVTGLFSRAIQPDHGLSSPRNRSGVQRRPVESGHSHHRRDISRRRLRNCGVLGEMASSRRPTQPARRRPADAGPGRCTRILFPCELPEARMAAVGDLSDSTVAARAADFLRAKHQKPFLLAVSLLDPHDICQWVSGHLPEDHPARRENMPPRSELPPLPANFARAAEEPEFITRCRERDHYGEENTSTKSWTRRNGGATYGPITAWWSARTALSAWCWTR